MYGWVVYIIRAMSPNLANKLNCYIMLMYTDLSTIPLIYCNSNGGAYKWALTIP